MAKVLKLKIWFPDSIGGEKTGFSLREIGLTTKDLFALAYMFSKEPIPQAEKIYAFIDSQNVNLGIKSQGWKLDWRKFKQYLQNKYKVEKIYLFIGKVAGNELLYTFLQKCGYNLIFKPTLERHESGKIIIKGNVDAELVLHAMIQYGNYNKAIIVSGDGDFRCLIEYLEEKGKLLKILAPTRHYSSLLRTFNKNNYIVRIDLLRSSLELKKLTGIRGRSKP